MVVQQTIEFERWLSGVRDQRAQNTINRRLNRLATEDHFGEIRSVGSGVSEMKIDYGPGYRLYFTRRGSAIVLLLVGGDKDSQTRDILKAQHMVAQLG